MQSWHDVKWNVNFVWATHCYAQKKRGEGGRTAGFTFTITVMIQSSLIIIPLPGMSAPIERGVTRRIPNSCLAGLAQRSRPGDLHHAKSHSLSVCVPPILSVCLGLRLCPPFPHRLSFLVWAKLKMCVLPGSARHSLWHSSGSWSKHVETDLPRRHDAICEELVGVIGYVF